MTLKSEVKKKLGVEHCAMLNCSYSRTCTTQQPHCCAYINKQALLFVDHFFREHNLSYAIIYGTLLGAIRNGTIIPWTQDIDIAIFNKSYLFQESTEKEIYEHGYLLFEVKECQLNHIEIQHFFF